MAFSKFLLNLLITLIVFNATAQEKKVDDQFMNSLPEDVLYFLNNYLIGNKLTINEEFTSAQKLILAEINAQELPKYINHELIINSLKNGIILITNLETGKSHTIPLRKDSTWIETSSNNKFIYVNQKDYIRVINLQQGTSQYFTKEGRIYSIKLSPDNKFLVINYMNNMGKISTFNLENYKSKSISHNYLANPVFSKNNKFLVLGQAPIAKIINFDCKVIDTIEHNSIIHDVEITQNSEYVITSSLDGVTTITDINTLDKTQIIHPKKTSLIKTSPDSNILLIAYTDGSIKIIDLKTKKEIISDIKKHEGEIFDIAISSNSEFAITSCANGTLNIIDLIFKSIKTIQLEEGIYSLIISPNSKYIVVRCNENIARIINLKSGEIIDSIIHDKLINKIKATSDSKFILTCSNDSTAKVTDLTNKKTLTIDHDQECNDIEFSKNLQYIITKTDKNVAITNINREILKSLNFMQIKLILWLFHVSKITKEVIGNDRRFPVYLNKEQTQIFLSLNTFIQEALKTNYILKNKETKELL
ncbi:MAG: hypothetical protein P4L22_06130 [Candidatus Babeliales bacterium]|nr:hypothetical protein [Candidatus Babeliales bacterium]